MIIKLLGTESLGVRGLSCSVELNSRKIVIDPGIALGWSRYKLWPHPFQIAIGAGIRATLIAEFNTASDIIISHFHGDHCPLPDANPYQLGIDRVKDHLAHCQIWVKDITNASPIQQQRYHALAALCQHNLHPAEGQHDGPLQFSWPAPHGQDAKNNTVMMSRIEEDGVVFVHASDIQLLDASTIAAIVAWKPDIVFASGPALYRYAPASSQTLRQRAWENALTLSQHVGTLILDHHLLRAEEGIAWLARLKQAAQCQVVCAADFMNRTPLLLEAWRKELYEWLPVPEKWHEDYQHGNVGVQDFQVQGWEALLSHRKISPCRWYACCPIRAYTEQGKLERDWIEQYCLVSNKNCVRYQMEEQGQAHPDNMLPNGEIRANLSQH